MRLTSLQISNFRNHTQTALRVGDGPVVITGENGAGKTNILEAISLLVPGRGLRNARVGQFQNQAADAPWAVFAELEDRDGDAVSIGTGGDPERQSDKRVVRINGQNQRGQNALAEVCAVVSLTPQMDQTFSEGSTSRRDFLDKLTANFVTEYVKYQSIYSHAKSERMALLTRSRTPDESWLATLEQRMAEQAVAIAAARSETLQRLQQAMGQLGEAFVHGTLSAQGEAEEQLSQQPAVAVEDYLALRYKQSRGEDAQSGRTSVGPHRSDFIVIHQGKNMPAELCSTGEQKALLLAISLAAVYARKDWYGEAPLLLLDEVVAHLDEGKREQLCAEIERTGAQCWMTGTDKAFFSGLSSVSQHFVVDAGAVQV